MIKKKMVMMNDFTAKTAIMCLVKGGEGACRLDTEKTRTIMAVFFVISVITIFLVHDALIVVSK